LFSFPFSLSLVQLYEQVFPQFSVAVYCYRGHTPGRLLRAPCTLVNDRIRLYFAVIHVIVLRSYIFVTVYGAIRSYTEENGDCIRLPCTKTVNDRFFSPYIAVCLRIRHGDIRSHVKHPISPYTVVYDRACSTWDAFHHWNTHPSSDLEMSKSSETWLDLSTFENDLNCDLVLNYKSSLKKYHVKIFFVLQFCFLIWKFYRKI
jgi:hypothetical protein